VSTRTHKNQDRLSRAPCGNVHSSAYGAASERNPVIRGRRRSSSARTVPHRRPAPPITGSGHWCVAAYTWPPHTTLSRNSTDARPSDKCSNHLSPPSSARSACTPLDPTSELPPREVARSLPQALHPFARRHCVLGPQILPQFTSPPRPTVSHRNKSGGVSSGHCRRESWRMLITPS